MPGYPRPRVIVFDVNETLSDLAPLAAAFTELGAPAHLAQLWFTRLLRDGFALTAAGSPAPFATLGAGLVREILATVPLTVPVDQAVDQILTSFRTLPLHDDVAPAITALAGQGLRLATLSNGSTSVADALLTRAGLARYFETLLSVEAIGLWKPARVAYVYAVEALQVPASHLMLVAAHPWDIHGAANAGLSTAWVNRTAAVYPEYLTPATVSVTSLVELAERLGSARPDDTGSLA